MKIGTNRTQAFGCLLGGIGLFCSCCIPLSGMDAPNQAWVQDPTWKSFWSYAGVILICVGLAFIFTGGAMPVDEDGPPPDSP